MAYLIDAYLDDGMPSLVLVDSESGQQRLCWKGDALASERSWKSLFKRLMLLSCADRSSLIQRSETPGFGENCLRCDSCDEMAASLDLPLLITNAGKMGCRDEERSE